MPYNSETGVYERRSTTVIDGGPDGDSVGQAIDVKLDQGIDDYVTDINHHNTNGNHYPVTSTHTDSRFLDQSPAGVVSWKDGVPAANAALKDFSNVANGAIAPAKVAQDASNRFMTDTERTKLSGIATGAQVNADITKAEIEAKLTGTLTSHGHAGVEAATPSTVAQRDSTGDLFVRTIRASWPNETVIAGAMAFRGNDTDSTYLRFCTNTSAIRAFLGVDARVHDAVGSVCFAGSSVAANTTVAAPGTDISGAGIQAASIIAGVAIGLSGTALTGTWRCLGWLRNSQGSTYNCATLFQRIA